MPQERGSFLRIKVDGEVRKKFREKVVLERCLGDLMTLICPLRTHELLAVA